MVLNIEFVLIFWCVGNIVASAELPPQHETAITTYARKEKTLMRHSLRISGHSKKRKTQFSLQPLMRKRFSAEKK